MKLGKAFFLLFLPILSYSSENQRHCRVASDFFLNYHIIQDTRIKAKGSRFCAFRHINRRGDSEKDRSGMFVHSILLETLLGEPWPGRAGGFLREQVAPETYHTLPYLVGIGRTVRDETFPIGFSSSDSGAFGSGTCQLGNEKYFVPSIPNLLRGGY